MSAAQQVVEQAFRHEYARLVAVLVRRAGLPQLEAVEDAAQAALLAALTDWARNGIPDDRGAWLYRVALNHLLGEWRRPALPGDPLAAVAADPAEPFFEAEVGDEQLRMIFVACDERLPQESRLAFALKTLCGFSTGEIAARLFTTEANVYKRLARAKERLREGDFDAQTPALESLRVRLPSVHAVLYVLFNEGFLSTHTEHAIREELCDEAIRLTTGLASHPVGAEPATFALLALMHLHAARLASRQDASGGLLLLEEQDRSRWDAGHLREGATWLERAGTGDVVSRFHLEAAIAGEHSFAPSFAQTRWGEIAGLYALLERLEPSPLYVLNRAVALAEAEGPQAGLDALQGVVPPTWLEGHYVWDAVLADLHRRAGHGELAMHHCSLALSGAPSEAMRRALRRRLRV